MLLNPLSKLIQNKKLPITSECDFTDDIWDLSKFNKIGRSKNSYIYNFSNIDYPYNYYAKKVVLADLFWGQRKSPSSSRLKLTNLRQFFGWLSEHGIRYIEQINLDLIIEFCESLDVKENTLWIKKYHIRIFLEELQLNFPSADFSAEYEYLRNIDKEKIANEREEGKYELIPFMSSATKVSVLDTIVSCAIADINNPDSSITAKKDACLILIVAETGMRIGEFHKLEIDKLIEVSVPNFTEKQYYLEFLTYKTSPTKGHMTITFLTSKAALAYNTLTNLLATFRKTKYLFIREHTGDQYGYEGSLGDCVKRFFARHQNDFDFSNFTVDDWAPFSNMTIGNNPYRYACSKDQIGQPLYYISSHHFRVTVATILYAREKRSLEWIKRHMNHLAEDMTIHYIREEAFRKNRINLVETIMKRASVEGFYLETDVDKVSDPSIIKELRDEFIKEAYNEINDFLEAFSESISDKRIYKHVNQIIDSILLKKIPLQESPIGFCVADALLVLCERQEYINLTESSYDLGIQIPTIESLPYDLKRYEDKRNVISYNAALAEEEPLYSELYAKEVSKMKIFVEKKLLPELYMLKQSDTDANGNSRGYHLGGIYPEPYAVDSIIEEVSRWISK